MAGLIISYESIEPQELIIILPFGFHHATSIIVAALLYFFLDHFLGAKAIFPLFLYNVAFEMTPAIPQIINNGLAQFLTYISTPIGILGQAAMILELCLALWGIRHFRLSKRSSFPLLAICIFYYFVALAGITVFELGIQIPLALAVSYMVVKR